MAKKVWEGEYDINTDWGGDASTEYRPLPGSAVQDVIKTELKKLDNNKVGYIAERDGTVYFSPSKDAYDNEQYMGQVISTQRYSMDLQKDISNKNVFLSGDTNKKFVWYFKTLEIATNSVYTETVTVEYRIENKTEGVDKLITTTINCDSDYENDGYTKVELDLDEYLTNGKSVIEIIVKGLRTKQERTLQQEITIVTLDIEDVTDFSKPFGNRFIAQTRINCTKGQIFYYEYKIDDAEEFIFDNKSFIGEGRFVTNDYNIDISTLSEGAHVFEYRLYINIGGESTYYTETQRIEFVKGSDYKFEKPQILLFSSYLEGEASKTNNGELIINGATQYVPYKVKYAVYNSEVSTTNVEFYDITNGENTIPVTTTVDNGVFYYYSVQSMDSGQKTIKVICKDINNQIIEGSDRIFYINIEQSTLNISEYNRGLRINFTSVGKNNDSQDKNTWVSNVSENGFINTATFSEEFDWSQGWTENGLVISEGCEVVFDYTPFPHQKDSATVEESNEFVGGDKGYTFEIEFMTQNVTNEDAIICNMENELNTNNCGLIITGSEIRFTTPGGGVVSSRFKEGDINRAAIVIHPERTSSGEFKGLVELYMNGVMSNITKYTASEKFEVFERDELGNASSKRLRFTGIEGADLVVKHIRAYNSVMTPDEAVNNYIIYRNDATEMLKLYSKNDVINDQGVITPASVLALGNIPVLVFVGRTNEAELAYGDGNKGDGKGNCDEEYKPGVIGANEENWYKTLEDTTNKKKNIDMDVIYYNPLDKSKNFKFIKAYITPQGTSSMYYPKKNYRIYTQKNKDTRCFFTNDEAGVLEFEDMMRWNFGETEEDRRWEKWRGKDNYKKRKYAFKDNAQAVKCWCLKADFAETSSSHNTGVARLWGDTLKNSLVEIGKEQIAVFKTNAQATTETNYNNNINGDMPDIRTTIDGFPIVVFGKKSYSDEYVFLGKYNFNNDKSTESVFGFCDIDDKKELTDQGRETINESEYGEVEEVKHTLDNMLDKYMCCVETLDNGNALANFSTMDDFDDKWEDAFEFRYMEIPEKPKEKDYKDDNGNWVEGGEEDYQKDYAAYLEDKEVWDNTRLKPFKHFAQWVYDTRWCDVNGDILPGLTEEEAMRRKEKFAREKWDHLDVWKMAAYYIYVMRFGAVDQVVKNSMLTSEGPFARDKDGNKGGYWDTTNESSPEYGRYYKWYYINYDNDTVMGVKNDGSLAYGPEITRKQKEGEGSTASYIYAGSQSTLWNNFDQDEDFQEIVRIADQGISKTMTYKKAISMFEDEQVGKWCERIYNKDAEYKYISPYMAEWTYTGDDENADSFVDKLFMLQGSRTAHRRWWLSRRFNLFDGKWSSGDFATKYVEVKCDYGSIGDTFSAVAGANAYFGYQINNKTFGDGAKDGGSTYEYAANEFIPWKLYKNIQIGDPIAIYGANDLLELNLQGISKNLASVSFNFGTNSDLGNKLERLILSIEEDDLSVGASYKTYANDEESTGIEKLKADYPYEITGESDFEDGGQYPTSDVELDAVSSASPKFYRIVTINDEGENVYTYFVKVDGGIRNHACKGISFDALIKLQTLNMAGYMGVNSIDLSKNKFINEVDVRYSNISTIEFGEGSRIKNLKASPKLTTLSLNKCDNLTLSNIYINNTPLKNDGGKNINTIEVENSTGLNHSNDFKDFILKWMKSGDISSKSLTLRNIKWTNVKIADIETIKQFLQGNEQGNRALQCIITGTIEMGPDKITTSDILMFNNLSAALGGSLIVKMPYPNIVLNSDKKEIIAGETAEYTYTLFPDAESIMNNGGLIDYAFVKEVTSKDYYDINDSRTNRYFSIIEDSDEVRDGVRISRGKKDNDIIVSTKENVIGQDTNTFVLVRLLYEGETKFDVAPLTIKEPTYAVGGVINGLKNVGEENTSYDYTLSLISNKNDEPIGTVNIEWTITGDNIETYISGHKVSEDKRTLTITTSSIQPNPTSDLMLTAKITNHDASSSVLPSIAKQVIIKKPLLLLNKDVVLTNETNPVVFNVCKEQGWAVSSDIVMTRSEAESITSIGTFFSNIKAKEGWSFEEFRYFTNVNLSSLEDNAFANSDITSIVFPDNIISIGDGIFENCSKLKDVKLNNVIDEISTKCFLNCSSLVNFELPDNITKIKRYSFGGTNIEKIIEKTSSIIEGNKAILVSQYSKLNTIENDAFEVEKWSIEHSTNKLTEIVLPKELRISDGSFNFTFNENLSKITIMNDEDSYLAVSDNILYANATKTVLVRAIPKATDDNVLESVLLESVTNVYPYAFYGCKTIKRLLFGDFLTEFGLGEGAFYNSSINVINLSRCKDLKAIKEFTFSGCKELTEVMLPEDEKLTSLGPNLFYDCMQLSAITIPNTVIELEGDKNAGDANTFIKTGIEELILPNSLVKAGRFFIQNCPNLKRIVFGDFYTSIGSGGSDRVIECEALEEVVLPITSYTNEDGLDIIVNTYIETGSPTINRCPNIKRMLLNKKDNNKLYINSNDIIYKVGNIDEITGEIVKQDKELALVPTDFSALTMDIDTKIIGPSSMRGCKIKDLVIPEGVEVIKTAPFTAENESSTYPSVIENVTIPNSIKYIGEALFRQCSKLTEVTLPECITTIPKHTFYYCRGLKTIKLLGEVTEINNFSFNGCTKLEELIIMSENAPVLGDSTCVYVASADTYTYHPFGYNAFIYTGIDSNKEENILYVPYNHNGYDSDKWVNPLQYENRGRFVVQPKPLEQEVVIKAIDSDGSYMTDGTLYFVSDSGDFIFEKTNDIKSATYDSSKGGYVLSFNNLVYHNEPVSVYKDAELNNKLGTFIAKYNINEYEVGSVVLSKSSRNLFATNIFGSTKSKETEVEEMANITKKDYEILLSRINQLTEIIEKIK